MPGRRLQILLDERRYRKVASKARRTGRSMAAIIREAIDELPETPEGRQAAVDAILAADLMPVPLDPADLRRELDATNDRIRE